MLIRLAHSPDPDDAFMFYGLSSGAVDPGPYEFEHILQDIQTLNDRAIAGEYEVTAISIHAYPYVRENYVLTNCGSSMGDGYGPMVVARAEFSIEQLSGKRIAIPGRRTTAFLALQLLLGAGRFEPHVVMFDQIPDAVARGEYDAGLVIHEGQLTYQRLGLRRIVDLGEWWLRTTGLPLPLGGNAVRRDLGLERCRELSRIVRASIEYSLAHREAAVVHALRFGRGLDTPLADRFVGMYVNQWTIDYGPRGRDAVRLLLRRGAEAGIVPDAGEIEFV